MATQTLKTGTLVTVKDTNLTDTITSIYKGQYFLKEARSFYSASDLVAEKTVKEKKLRQPIKQTSEKTGKLKAIYAIIAPQWKRHNKLCRMRFAGCTHHSTQIHHMNGRRGFWLIISKWFLPCCANCHRYATHHSAEAIAAAVTCPPTMNIEYEFNSMERKLMKKQGVNPPT